MLVVNVRLIACQSHLTFEVFCWISLVRYPSFWHTSSKPIRPKIPLSRSYSVGTHVAVPKTVLRCFFGRGKTGGITHGKIDDLQMRVGVSGQTLWAVNEGA
jgi:hypothetical protein